MHVSWYYWRGTDLGKSTLSLIDNKWSTVIGYISPSTIEVLPHPKTKKYLEHVLHVG